MQTINVTGKTAGDGNLHLDIPVGKPNAEFDVVVIVQQKQAADPGWPPGYFESTYGSITDDTFVRPAQDELRQ